MKKTIISLLFLFSSHLSADTEQLCPLHEADPHFIYYRSLMIEGSVLRIQDIIENDNIPFPMKEIILGEIELIKFNLGYPLPNN